MAMTLDVNTRKHGRSPSSPALDQRMPIRRRTEPKNDLK